jgi:molybdate transport system substrate-binding protein
VRAAGGELKAIELPDELKPQVAYGVAVVKGAKHPEQARRFLDGLLTGPGRAALERAGFLPPPGT